jgi:hypothetical protein
MRAVPGTVAPETDFARFLAQLWGSDRETGRPGTGSGPGSYVTSGAESIMLRSAIRGGLTNENLLANLVFFQRHPERNGRLISREGDGAAFGILSQEWLRIRDTQVRPLLAGAAPAPGPPAGPVPYPGPWVLPLRDALVILKRAETQRAAAAGYRPAGPDRERIDQAISRIRAFPKYLVNDTTYRVTFAEQPGRKVRIETIEDFVLFVEAVEAQYPAAPASQVVSEIRQVWYSDEHWELLVGSNGIIERGVGVDIETEPNPIATRFDMDHLQAAATPTGLCAAVGGRVISTSMGSVNVGHLMAGIDARLSGFPASNPHWADPRARFKYDKLRQFSNADPTAFATFAGDLGQAYAVFLYRRYAERAYTARLSQALAECAKPSELLGDMHGYIAVAVAADARGSGRSPTGTAVTASAIVRDMYLVAKASPVPSYRSYLERVSGARGQQLAGFVHATSLNFARLWYAKVRLDKEGQGWWPPEQFDGYLREFADFDGRQRRGAAAQTLDGLVRDFLGTARKRLG